jgi:hypothetical protein
LKETSDPQRHHMVEIAYSFEESTSETITTSRGDKKPRMFRVKRKSPSKHRKRTSDLQRRHMVESAYSFEESTLQTTTATPGANNDDCSE